MQGFILGLASGTTCLAYCAPVLIPFFLGEGKHTHQNWWLLVKFLTGRLAGYLLFGLAAWLAYRWIFGASGYRELIFGGVYVLLGGLLVFYGLGKMPMSDGGLMANGHQPSPIVRQLSGCPISPKTTRIWFRRWPAMLPVAFGFFTGLNLCPPFLAAFANASYTGSLAASLFFFAAFFVGTSLFFVPVPFIGKLNHIQPLRTIGKFAAVIMAAYYLYMGIHYLIGGIHHL